MSFTQDENRSYWSREPCGSDFSSEAPLSAEFFEEIEAERYRRQPFVFSFAQFSRYHGKRVLEIGTGLGVDFLQWVRSGARAHGVDLTAEAIAATGELLEHHGLSAADLQVADAEALPYPDQSFDLVYSWGVIHHTPDVQRALAEIVRVLAPGGRCKLLVYHTYSLAVLALWLRQALGRLRPWKSPRWCVENYIQNRGTRSYSRSQARQLLAGLPVTDVEINTVLTETDLLTRYGSRWLTLCARLLAYVLGGDRVGFYLTLQFSKRGAGPE